MEHIVCSSIYAHLDENKILSDVQHGFRKKRSCETQLIITVDDLAQILNSVGGQADVILLDFSKAFDKVPHCRLRKAFILWYSWTIINLDKKFPHQ